MYYCCITRLGLKKNKNKMNKHDKYGAVGTYRHVS